MRIILYPIAIIILALIVAFTASNTQSLEMGLWPLEQQVALPAFLWVLLSILVGFVLGIFALILTGQKKRAKVRMLKNQVEEKTKEAEKLKKELENLSDKKNTELSKLIA
ncbi:MAG: LapA family protein [Alphaproteobacteria bacterium]